MIAMDHRLLRRNATPSRNTTRETLRALRSAAALSTKSVAAATGTTAVELRASMGALAARGDCAQTVAAATGDSSAAARVRAFSHPACPPWAKRAVVKEYSAKACAAANGVTGWLIREPMPGAARRALVIAARGDYSARRQAASGVGAALLWQLSVDPKERVRETVAKHSTRGLLAVLSSDNRTDVRSAVASNPNAGTDLLRRLSSDTSQQVRSGVASNPAVDADVLSLLSSDDAWQVRRSAARHPAATIDMLHRLAFDSDDAVRSEVVQNPSTPLDALNQLASDDNPATRKRASARLAEASEAQRA